MGHGSFDRDASSARAALRASTGQTAFTHHTAAVAGTVDKLHETLDLRNKPFRECRDNDDNPNSVPIAILVDVTGSMGGVAKEIIDNLHKVVGLIRDEGAVPNPAMLFGAIGDAKCDDVPIQMGEFEAHDELAEKHLSNIYLENGGGGQGHESYDLGLWFFAHQVQTDHWDKRGQKGFLFFTGDEAPWDTVVAKEVTQHLGVPMEQDVPLSTVVAQLQEKWEVFCVRPGGTGHFGDEAVKSAWKALLPAERVIDVYDWEEIPGLIAGTISVMGGLSVDAVIAAADAHGLKLGAGASTMLTSLGSSAIAMAQGAVSDSEAVAPEATRV
jgi:hypothetical protein